MMTSPSIDFGPNPSYFPQAGMWVGRIPGQFSRTFKETGQMLQAQALMSEVLCFLHPDCLWQEQSQGQGQGQGQTHLQATQTLCPTLEPL